MVLQEIDERLKPQAVGRLSTLPAGAMGRHLALVTKAFGQRAAQQPQRSLRVIPVVTVALAGGQHMHCVMEIVVPLRGRIARLPAFVARQAGCLVAIVFHDQVDMPFQSRSFAHGGREFRYEIGPRVIHNRMDGIQAQSVEIEFVQPVKRVMHEEVAHHARALAVEVDRRTPWRVVRRIEELRRVRGKIVSLRSEMVVDHVEEDHQAARMRRRHQALEILRCAVGRIRGKQQDAVVSPVAFAGKIRHRHEFDRRHAKPHQIVQALDGGVESTLWRKGADMQFVDHGLLPRTAAPGLVRPFEPMWIDHRACCVHIPRVVARGRIGHIEAPVDAK